jgi:transposase
MKRESKRKKRRQYDAEFKSNILKMNEDGRSVSSLAESFGINETLIYRWKSLAKDSFEHTDRSVVEENKRLRSELQEARQERDILKKALSIFSRHS